MDWPSSMAKYGYDQPPEEQQVDGDAEEDFYGYGSSANAANGGNHNLTKANGQHVGIANLNGGHQPTSTGQSVGVTSNLNENLASMLDKALAAQKTAPTLTPEQQKADNQKKAATLRAKLIAQRQSTPLKGISWSETPSKMSTLPPKEPRSERIKQEEPNEHNDSPSDVFGLESLLAEGKAAAEAKMKQNGVAGAQQPVPLTNGDQPEPVAADVATEKNNSTAASSSDHTTNGTQQRSWATALTDHYYADLSIWLEVTGYHDVEYRNSKLRAYKERKSLEEEAARIQERLDKLRQAEQAEVASIRSSSFHQATPTQLPRPPLPAVMPDPDAVQQPPANKSKKSATTNGTKRAHSPEPVVSDKAARRPSNFRTQGTNQSPESRPTPRRARSPSPSVLERRISYPDIRRRSVDNYNHSGNKKIDPRDQMSNYYKRDVESAAPPATYSRDTRYDRPAFSYDAPSEYENRGRLGYSRLDRPSVGGYGELHRGRAGLDLRKGDVRYFMIKSWNYENVETAMRDSLWATQEKNEQLLTDAYKTSRHVVLLFSVNKSMQFQGYALMTSPPDPSLPKPPFCAKLHWATSPAFALRWLATTPVHFRHVGHLKNEFNLDTQRNPAAVLVGKDGQEISEDAGIGVVEILDDVQEAEDRKKRRGSYTVGGGAPERGW